MRDDDASKSNVPLAVRLGLVLDGHRFGVLSGLAPCLAPSQAEGLMSLWRKLAKGRTENPTTPGSTLGASRWNGFRSNGNET